MNPTNDNRSGKNLGTAARRPVPAPELPRTPPGLEQRLLARARNAGFRTGDRLIVGFSGGRDSLVLAAALRRVQTILGVDFLLVHVDHRLRPTSGNDATAAADLAGALGLPCRIIVVPESPVAMHPGVGVEEAARRARYQILFEGARETESVAVVTAHHQGDQAETVLLHLLRGGGVHGAAGMAERSPAPLPFQGQSDISPEDAPWLWRPLLRESRDVIDRSLRQLGMVPVEDPSNDDLVLRRNLVRRQFLPQIEAAFPGAIPALARFAELAAEDDAALSAMAEAVLEGGVDPGGRLRPASLDDQPLALQRRMVRRWIATVTGWNELSADRTDALLALARKDEGGRAVEIGAGWTVFRERGMLRATHGAERDAGRAG